MTLFNFYINKKVTRNLTLLLLGLLVSFASFGQAPAPISSLGGVCAGETRTFVDATSGGTWSTSNSVIATVGSSTGSVTGASLGTATITYTTSGGFATITATVTPVPCGPVVLSNVCVGATVVEGGCTGTWSTGSTTVATIDSVTGAVTGIAPGSATIISMAVPGCYVANTITVYPAPPPIAGVTSFCSGASIVLSDFTPGATWSSANTAVASVSGTGTVFGISAGTAVINFTTSLGCAASRVVSVNPLPAVYTLSTGGSYCSGATGVDITLSGSNTGVSYQLFIPGGPTPPPAIPGVGGALDFGYRTAGTYEAIAENAVTGCTDTMAGSTTVTSAPSPNIYSVTGGGSYCPGGTGMDVYLGSSDPGVMYRLYCGATEVDSLPGTGAPLNFGPQTATGTYIVIARSVTTGCTDAMAGSPIISITTIPTITGAGSICSGGTTSVTAPGFTGGAWASANTAIASISITGTVFAISPGTAAISYVTSTGCTASTTLTVNPLPTVFILSVGGSYCSGGTGADITLSGSSAGYFPSSGTSYKLIDGTVVVASLPGTGGALDFGHFPVGIYTAIAADLSSGCATTMANRDTVTALPVPVISGPTAVCAGATISETAPGFTGGTWSSSNTAIAPVNTTGLVTCISAGTANITYTSTSGCTGTTTITINPSPVSIGSVSVCTGSTTTLISDADYWSSSNTAVATVSSSTGIVTGIAAGTSIITYALGGPCVTAKAITVNPTPSTYTINGGGTYCIGGTGVPIGLSGSDVGVNYQLYMGATLVGLPVTGSGSAISFGFETVAGAYTVVADNTVTTCTKSMSGADTVTISAPPTVYNVTGGGNYCAGGSGVHVGLNSSNSGITYKLYNGGSLVTTVSGTGSSVDFGEYTSAGIYHAVATNAYGCNSSMTGSDTIGTLPSPNLYTVTGGGSYCAGGAGAHVGLGSSDAGISYQLFNGTVAVGVPIAGVGSSLDFGISLDTGVYTVVATNIATGCTSTMSDSARINIISLPTRYTITGGGSYCTGGSGVDMGLSSSSSGVNYQLYDGSVAVGSSHAGTGSTIDFGDETASGVYTVVATNPGGSGCTDTMVGSTTVTLASLPAIHTVTGGGSRCASGAGVGIGLDGSSAGVDYTLYNAGSAIASMPGTGAPLNFGLGTVAGTYTVVATNVTTGCTNSMAGSAVITVIPSVTPSVTITATPGDTVCAGTMVTLTATLINGGSSPTFSWIVNGVNMSTDSIYTYMPGNRDVIYEILTSSAICAAPAAVTSNHVVMVVHTLPAISGGSSVCVGSAISLTDTSGGIWTSSNPAVATIATIGATTGVVSGVGPGTVTLTYTLDTACIVTTTFTVHSLPVITASSSAVSCGGGYTLTGSGGLSYTWWPSAGVSCTTCATTDVIPESTTTYYVTGTNAEGCSDSAAVTVDGNRISGYISPAISGSMKVWLIQFNATDSSIAALDSTTSCISGGLPYYEFDDKPAGNYLVKAFIIGGTPGASGYIPTYGLSSPHWDSATSIIHASAADTLHIDLIYGTVPTGPGFIGGLISSGAGRGTSTVPAVGMLVYLMDAVTNRVLTYNYTDSSGAYAFNNIAYGNYVVYPEDYDYNTTPWPTLSLTSTADSVTNANFKQHTTARTITPVTAPTGTNTLVSSKGEIRVYPNPNSGILNIQWADQQTGTAALLITDMLGREAYKSTININAISRETPIEISSLKNGIYLISIKTERTDFNGKLIIEK